MLHRKSIDPDVFIFVYQAGFDLMGVYFVSFGIGLLQSVYVNGGGA
jgi:hypothetical protein